MRPCTSRLDPRYMKRTSKFSIENFVSNVIILIVISFIIGTVASQQITTTQQLNSYNKQARLNAETAMKLQLQQQRINQQQQRYEIRTERAKVFWNTTLNVLVFLFNSVLVLFLFACVALLVFYVVRLARKSTQNYFEWHEQTQHELKLEREHTKRIRYQFQPHKGMFEGLTLSGNLTYNPSERTSTTNSLTQHQKAPKSLNSSLEETKILDAVFTPKITQNFKDLLALPTPKNHLALGYDMATQEPVYVPITSQAIGAISGGGKSSTLTALAAQLPKKSIVLCDSHRDTEQGLTSKLAPIIDVLAIDSAESVAECKDSMAWTLEEFHTRRTSGKDTADFKPLIFIADEWLALQRDSELATQAEHLAHTLIHEARKFNMYIWIAGQTFKTKHATDAHHAIGQKIIGKMDTKQARMLSGMSADLLPKDTLFLNTGESFLISWNDPTPRKVYTPYADFSQVSSSYKPVTKQQYVTDVSEVKESRYNHDITINKNSTNPVTDLSTEDKRILSIYLRLGDAGKVVNEMFKSSTGKKLTGSPRMKKLELVNQVVRNNLQCLAQMEQDRLAA